MEFPGKEVAECIQLFLKQEIAKFRKKKLKLSAFYIGTSEENLSFIYRKKTVAKQLGIAFELIHHKKTPFFEKLIREIKAKSQESETTGIIIQQPVPAQLMTESIYNYIDITKEIEGHKNKTSFIPPVSLTVLTVLKYYFGDQTINKKLIVDLQKDYLFFKRMLRTKKIVLIGRGITGGKPIGKTLTELKINYIGINSKTPNPEAYIKEADIVITAVGKKVITVDMVKPGALLINIGLRRENGTLKGDYDEKEIKHVASCYTPTPGGTGPIDVLYLCKNLLQAAKMQ